MRSLEMISRPSIAILPPMVPMHLIHQIRQWSILLGLRLVRLGRRRSQEHSRRKSLRHARHRRLPSLQSGVLLLPLLLVVASLILVPAGAQTIQAPPAPVPAQSRLGTASPSPSQTAASKAKSKHVAQMSESWWLRFWVYSVVVIGGAHGGLIYGISRNRGVIIPHYHQQQDSDNNKTYTKLELGYLGDIVVGIGGGIIIFNLVPQVDSDIFRTLFKNTADIGMTASLIMKILALSLIGGFAGISLFDEAAKRIRTELEEVRTQARANNGLINQLQGESDVEAEIQYLINPMIDPSIPPLSDSQRLAFEKVVLKAPLHLRNKVFEQLQQAHNSYLITGNDPPLSKSEIETRMVLQLSLSTGFNSLIAAAEEQEKNNSPADLNKHRYLAHNGFIHDQVAMGNEDLGMLAHTAQHWRQGEEDLNAAIALRDQINGDKENFWHYNLERMLCRFKLGNHDVVIAELTNEVIVRWLRIEPGVIYAQTKLMPNDFLDFLRSACNEKPQLKDLCTRLFPPGNQQQSLPTTLQLIRTGGSL